MLPIPEDVAHDLGVTLLTHLADERRCVWDVDGVLASEPLHLLDRVQPPTDAYLA